MTEDPYFGTTDDADAELLVVQDHSRAQDICSALLQAGLEHVLCLPDSVVSDEAAPQGRHFWDRLAGGSSTMRGPWHIVVREEELARARRVLAESGLQGG
jgi:hypothetical protein